MGTGWLEGAGPSRDEAMVFVRITPARLGQAREILELARMSGGKRASSTNHGRLSGRIRAIPP